MLAKQHINAQSTSSQVRCFYCAEPSLSTTIIRNHKANIASIACKACKNEVAVAVLSDGSKIAKCPKCFAKATLAFGKRNGGGYFVAFSCSRCGWVASEAFMKTASSAFKLLERQLHEPTNGKGQTRCLDGVPTAYEAALEAYYKGEPICPFCLQPYKQTDRPISINMRPFVVTIFSCDCGDFAVSLRRIG